MLTIVKFVRRALPDAPIGVEPYIDDPADVRALREGGADEIKLNVEAATDGIFRRACLGRDRNAILKSLERSVEIFGEGKVTSNIIFGFGEADADVLECVGNLAEMGVVPNLRMLRVNDGNRARLRNALGREPPAPEPERVVNLAIESKRILRRNRLTTLAFKTMCFPCMCCDIVPFRDV